MIDLHNHLLPGIDDGPRTTAESLEMARLAVDAGITRMVCTPHVLPDAAPSPARIAGAVADLRGELDAAGIALQIDGGAEIALDVAFQLDDDALRGYSLGGGGAWVLLEMPFEGWPLRLPQFIGDLEMRGFRAVLAHPERARSVQLSVDRVRDLVGRGALVQITAEAVTGEYGPLTRQVARTLVTNGLAHFLASDAHSATRRPPRLYPALEQAARWMRAEPAELGWMVTDGPRALLAGGPVRPPRLGVGPDPRPAPRPQQRDDRPPRPPRGGAGGGPARPGRPGPPRRQTSR